MSSDNSIRRSRAGAIAKTLGRLLVCYVGGVMLISLWTGWIGQYQVLSTTELNWLILALALIPAWVFFAISSALAARN
jgi:uncharacterized membrane protein (DUF485 family)